MTTEGIKLVARGNCIAGTSFYICKSNGFTGCCSVDPCDLTSCPDATSTGSSTSTTGPTIVTFNPSASLTGSTFDLTDIASVTLTTKASPTLLSLTKSSLISSALLSTSALTAASSSTLIALTATPTNKTSNAANQNTLLLTKHNHSKEAIAVTVTLVGFVVIMGVTFCFFATRHHRRARVQASVTRGEAGTAPTDKRSATDGSGNGCGIFAALKEKFQGRHHHHHRHDKGKPTAFNAPDNAHAHNHPACLVPGIERPAPSCACSPKLSSTEMLPNLDSKAIVPSNELEDTSLAHSQPAARELCPAAEAFKDGHPRTREGTSHMDAALAMWPQFQAVSPATLRDDLASNSRRIPKPARGMSWAEYKYAVDLRADGLDDSDVFELARALDAGGASASSRTQQNQQVGLMIEPKPATENPVGDANANIGAHETQQVSPMLGSDEVQGGTSDNKKVSSQLAPTQE